MKLFLLVGLCLAAVSAYPQLVEEQYATSPVDEVRELSRSFESTDNGYRYAYELSDGQKVNQNGESIPGVEPETGSINVDGSFQFVGDDGVTYSVTYTANENGFSPQGAHLPLPPQQIAEYAQLRQEHPELFWSDNQQPQQQPDDEFIQ